MRPGCARLAPDLEILQVVVGLWQVADQERLDGPMDPEKGARAMAEYVRSGLTTFDMADHYGSAEALAGTLVRRQKKERAFAPEVRLLTKWVPPPGTATPEATAEAVDRARARMGVNTIDLLQFHPWNYADPNWLDALFHLAEHRKAGTVRHVGLTNCDAVHLDMAVRSGVPVVSNQVCCSLLDRRAQGDMSRVCRRHGVRLLAYGALAGGFLTDRWLGRPEPPASAALSWSQMKYLRFVRQAGGWDRLQSLLRTLRRVADRLGVSMANVACRYVLEQPAVAAVIVGARLGERSHAEDNLRLFEFALDEDARDELEEAANRTEPIPGDCGDEYRRPPFLTASGDLRHHLDGPPSSPYPVVRREPQGARHVASGTPWEQTAGYSRAVRRGDRIWVSGTTASHGRRRIGGDDAAAQAHFAIDKIEGALQSLGAELGDVVRTRVYVRDLSDWEAVARVHGARLGAASPANTLVQAGLAGDGLRVEIEADAVVHPKRRPGAPP